MLRFSIVISIMVLFFMSSCSPKVAKEVVKEEKKEVKKVDNEPRPTPCTMFKDLEDGEDVKGMFFIFHNFLKTNEYDQALEYWSPAVRLAPGANGRMKYHFDDGIKIFKHYYGIEKDPAKRKSLIDSINWIYDKRLECFGDEAYVLGRKAFDFYYYFNKDVSQDEIFDMFAKAVDAKKEKTDYFVINPFSKMIYDRFVGGKLDTLDAKRYANHMINAIKYGTEHCKGTECQAWDMIKDYAPKLLDNFEAIKGFYPCEYYSMKYLDIFDKGKNSCDTVNLVHRKLMWGGCDISDVAYEELKKLKSGKCYVAPPEPGPLRKAFNSYNEGNFKEAVKNFEIFVNKTDDVEKKTKYLYMIAKIYYRDLKNFGLSRKYALKAAKLKSGWGEPYLLIGKLYASSGPICGPGRGWDSQIVTWPAIDIFKYAKRIDSSVAKEANKLIRSYERFMPSIDDIFQRTYKEGQKFKVGCWINETTTIRAAKK